MSSSTFRKEDYADFRLNLALRKVGQKVLLKIFNYAFPKSPKETFHDYFSSNCTLNYKHFDTSQKEKLKKDKTGEHFDITLIFKLLVHGCKKVYPQENVKWRTEGEFEFYLGRIKNTRNNLVHSSSPIPYEELNDRILSLKDLFTGLLETAQIRFDISDRIIKAAISEVENDLQVILSSPLSQTDVDEYLITEGVVESKVRYKKLSYINPVDFFIGLEFSTKIDDVFVTLEIKKLESHEEGQRVNINNLLKSFLGNTISLLIVEGLAGSGKTTLSKYILSQWREESSTIQGLDQFTFLLFLQCNNMYINSVYDLIASIIPETSRRFNKEELIESVFCQKLLIVVDGIDEAHPGTKAVLKEVFHRSQGKNIKFFCTSRPEKVHWVYRIKGELKCGALSIVGISKENRVPFVKKLYSYYSNTIQTQKLCPLSKVIQTLDKLSYTFIISDLKLPLFLALFTYLCTVEPTKMEGLNSVVSLYDELITALKDRLLTRSLAKTENSSFSLDEDEILEVIDDCFCLFCDEAFSSLVQEKETFSKESLAKIKEHSTTIHLNVKDVLSAFLVVKIVLTPFGIEEIVGFPHKGLKEFLAAKAVAKKVQLGESVFSVFKSVQEQKGTGIIRKPNQLELDTSHMKYQTLIPYLSGILVKENLLTDENVNEILKLFRKAGAYLASQWLSLLVSLNFHYLACEFMLMKFKKLDISEDYFDALLALLQYNSPKEVILRVDSGVNYSSKLKKILTQLNKYDCSLKLLLRHNVRQPKKKTCSDVLNVLNTKNSKCDLNWFEGTADSFGIRSLPQSVRVLFLGIGTKEQAKALQMIGQNSDIMYLKLHVERDVEPQDLPTIQEVFDFFLFLSGVKPSFSDVTWVTKVVERLSSNKKYGRILFPSSELTTKYVYKILTAFEKGNSIAKLGRGNAYEGVKGGIYVSSSLITAADEMELKAYCNRVWGCQFGLLNEEEIWSQ